MIKRLVIFLIRRKLGLKLYEEFRFTNQKSNDTYYFNDTTVMKEVHLACGRFIERSSVSLNWLLDDECKIEKVRREGQVLK